jgi:hypothetical protein
MMKNACGNHKIETSVCFGRLRVDHFHVEFPTRTEARFGGGNISWIRVQSDICHVWQFFQNVGRPAANIQDAISFFGAKISLHKQTSHTTSSNGVDKTTVDRGVDQQVSQHLWNR